MAATTGELLVTVHGASDLQDCEEARAWGDMDPYVTLAFTRPSAEGAPSAATRTAMKGGTNPSWQDETLALPVTADPGSLRVEVLNQNRAAPDDLVGFGQCSVYEALQGGAASSQELAVPLTAHPSGKAQGFVHLRLAFRPLPADQAAAAARAEMAEHPQLHGHDTEPLPALPGVQAQPETPEAVQPPALSDLRPISPREKAYDRVHRPGYTVPGSTEG